jgi:peptide/nickel transport system substrate-binding protein
MIKLIFREKIRSFFSQSWAGLRLTPKLSIRHIPLIFENFTRHDLIKLSATLLVILIAGGFLIFGVPGTTASNTPSFGGSHIEGLIGQPRFINPILAPASGIDTDLSKVVYAQLLKFDKDLQLVPDLAATLPTVSEDQKTYTLKLKENLKWHDGRPIRSDDVLYTIEAIQNSDFESPLQANWARVGVQKIDDLTLNFTLRDVSASFIINFTLGILPKHVWENLDPNQFRLSDLNLKPIGSGPFGVKEIKKTSDGTILAINLEANENYHEGRPYLDNLTFKFLADSESLITAYQGREIDSLGYLPFDRKTFIEASEKVNQHQINLPQYQAVFFNLSKNKVLQDKAVRQALWLATDRREIIDQVYLGFGQEAYGPVLIGNLGYDPSIAEKTHLSLEEAADILNRGKWVFDEITNVRKKGDLTLEFNLTTNNFVLNVKTAQIIKQQWEQIGAKINLVVVSPTDLQQENIRLRDFDALLFAQNTGADPDPFAFWHSTQVRSPGLNISGFKNTTADKLLTDARQTNDVTIRTANYQQFQEIITDELPAIFLDSAVYVYNVPKKIQGINLTTIIHPSDRFVDVNKWFIKTK